MSEDLSNKKEAQEVTEEEDAEELEFITESNKFKQMLFENLHGVSAKFNMKYPINPKITYEYPAINPIICQNIVSALYKYPKFYTQTLHLMNKMNLPCPLFDSGGEANFTYFSSYPIQSSEILTRSLDKDMTKTRVDESSSESEIETEFDRSKAPAVAPAESQIKKVNVKSLLKSSAAKSSKDQSQSSTNIDQVFDR